MSEPYVVTRDRLMRQRLMKPLANLEENHDLSVIGSTMRERGIIVATKQTFGFIEREGRTDDEGEIFVHKNFFSDRSPKNIRVGHLVEFDWVDSENRPGSKDAVNAVVIGERELTDEEKLRQQEHKKPKDKVKIDYNTKTIPELREILLERGLPVSGVKALLVARLEEDDRPKEKKVKKKKTCTSCGNEKPKKAWTKKSFEDGKSTICKLCSKQEESKRGRVETGPVIAPYEGEIFSCVVIDGTNVIHLSGKGKYSGFSFQRILSTQLEVEKLGWPTLMAMKANTFGMVTSKKNKKEQKGLSPEEKKYLKQMREMGKLTLIDTPQRGGPDHQDVGIDDEFLIKTAIAKNGWILSNDRYRDHIRALRKSGHEELAKEIQERWIELNFVGNDSTPIFNLPRNMASKLDTEVVESAEYLEAAVAEYNNVEVRIRIGGKIVCESVNLPLREPIGRPKMMEYVPKELHDSLVSMSRAHFRLDSKKELLWVTDLDSKNGTMLNGVSIPPTYANRLNREDACVRIGPVELLFGEGG